MSTFADDMVEYRTQLEKGSIQKAYRGLMEYIMRLKIYFQNRYPAYNIPGSIYYGYMDMTYFSVVPDSLKAHNLKIAIVFVHDSFRFEVWLSGYNRQVQSRVWKTIKESGWNQYHMVVDPIRSDAILEHVLAEDPDFGDLDKLTETIETGTMKFIGDMEKFFAAL